MKKLVLLWMFLPSFLLAYDTCSIICVHIGNFIPKYLEVTLSQARLFNPNCKIVLIASNQALKDFSAPNSITLLASEEIPLTKEHIQFQRHIQNMHIQPGLWSVTIERFFYLYDYMIAAKVKNIFHIENDVLIYANLETFLPILNQYYSGMATTFESPTKGIAGFFYVSNTIAFKKLIDFFNMHSSPSNTDMKLLGAFWLRNKKVIDCFPMIPEEYFIDHKPPALFDKNKVYCQHIEEFGYLFDGAAIGVFFDGFDLAKVNFPKDYFLKKPFDPSHLEYVWELDVQGRKVPYAIYNLKKYRICNLHIASKRLEKFAS